MNDYNKLEELSFLLPFIGVFLFSPALLSIFTDLPTLFGAPFLHIYLFTCWIVLIAISYLLTQKFMSISAPSGDDDFDMDEFDLNEKEIRK